MNRFLLFVALLFAPFLIRAQCLSGWFYKTPVTVTNTNASVLTSFQVSITVNTQALISAGKMNASGNDIRFTDASCNNLPYWIQSGINTASTIIWVNVNSLAASGPTVINLYYGNPSAAAATDGNATFLLFDDFNGSTIDATKWTTSIGGTYSVSGGSLSLSTAYQQHFTLRSQASFTGPYYSEMMVNSASGDYPSLAQFNSGTFDGMTMFSDNSTMYVGATAIYIDGYTAYYGGGQTVGNRSGIWSFSWNGVNSVAATWPGGSVSQTYSEMAAPSYNFQTGFGLLAYSHTTGSMSVDWFRARKYAANTPTPALGTEVFIQQAQTITFNALPSKTYGDADFAPGATSTGPNTITYSSDNTAVATIVNGKIHIVGAGTANITAAQAGSTLYLAATNVTKALTVVKAAVTVTATAKTKNYGDTDPTFTYTITAGALIGSDVFTGTLSRTAGENVGQYAINQNTLALSNNYTLTYIAAKLTIGAVALTVTATDVNKPYGSTLSNGSSANGFTVTGLKNSETVGSVTFIYGTGAAASALPNTYTGSVVASAATGGTFTAGNYTITYNAANIIVGKAALIITANSLSKTYGSANPSLTVTYSGLVNGDTQSSLTTQPVVVTTATLSSAVGAYSITASGAAAANYTISYVQGSLTVNPAGLIITAVNQSKTYGAANPALTVIYSGFVNGDTQASMATQPGVVTTATLTSGVGAYPITAGNASAANYTITYVAGTLMVSAAALNITAANQSRSYGAANPPLTVSFSGFVNGDTQASLTTQPNVTTTAIAASPTGFYPIDVSGAAAANYTITYTAGTLNITPAALTITATNQSKVYGTANPALTFTVNGFVNNDTQAVFTTQPGLTTTATLTSGVGSYPITASGAVAANYTIGYTAGALTVTPATLNISADNQTRVYGTANPVFTVTYIGFINGDTQSSLTTQATITTAATLTTNVGTYPIVPGGAAAANYSVTYTAGTLTITPATRTLSFTAPTTKTYGNADFSAGATASTGETVIYSGYNTAVITITNGVIHIVGAGSTSITASVAASLNYTSAPTVTVTLVINKASQTINFNALANLLKGGTFDLSTVTASSGLPVTFVSADPLIASVLANTLTGMRLGTTSVTASQPGNANYLAAANVVENITVTDPAGDEILVRQAVSPNGDGINDFLYIEGIANHLDNRVTIINRNGIKIFEISGYDNSSHIFDGHSNITGAFQQQGTYFYLIEFSDAGVSRRKTGYFVLKY